MKKLIEIEFPDDFVPPDRFEAPIAVKSRGRVSYESGCDGCPFYIFDDEYDEGYCGLAQELEYGQGCPIKKFF